MTYNTDNRVRLSMLAVISELVQLRTHKPQDFNFDCFDYECLFDLVWEGTNKGRTRTRALYETKSAGQPLESPSVKNVPGSNPDEVLIRLTLLVC